MTALLRVAGLPIRLWTAAGNPALVADLRELLAEEEAYAAYARSLADWVGALIPDAEARAELLVLRRDLHNGRLVCSDLPELARATAWSTALGLRRAAVDEDIDRERERLRGLPWRLVDETLARAVPELVEDMARRLDAGEDWGSKRLRQRSEYLLRMIARGAAKPTPRGWLAHVGRVEVAGTASWPVVGEHSAQWVSNVNADRRGAVLDGGTLTMNGLTWVEGDRLRCWSTTRVVEVRRSPLLDAVRNVLADGVHDVDELVRRLAPTSGDLLRGFLQHLVDLGVVQLSRPPRTSWDVPMDGFVDVYRRVQGAVPVDFVARTSELALQALRLAELLPRPPEHPVLATVGSAPRPVTDLVAEFLAGDAAGPVERRRPPELPKVLTPQLLDQMGLPPAELPDWPLDCLVRPMADGAVLEAILPAGVLDARFAAALTELGGEPPQVASYREFLAARAAEDGATPVELLVPPLDDRAANAVRRPAYCPLWTGDADASAYLPSAGRYLPLDRITVRREGNRIIAEELGGRRLWPTHHATRTPIGPWELVLTLLTAATPRGPSMSFGNRMAAFPERDFLPSLEIRDGVGNGDGPRAAGALVLSGRHWRIRPPATFRDLVALDLPRCVFARAVGGKPRPVDLHSLAALRELARLGDPVVLEEMLPDPDHMPLRDRAGEPVAGQLLVRLPHRRATTAVAVGNQEGDSGWNPSWPSTNWTVSSRNWTPG
ncbi:lantibiotic dehydratase [Kutzneria sp. NPDC052558]|uniref:lantibiotic dehydratase n=1 Tax=Kutzneria sp. NPDC052558 TaxID=3364121 RepID=UPI0037C77B31